MNEKGKAEVNPATCKGCGVCVASCRSGAPNLLGFTEGAILAQDRPDVLGNGLKPGACRLSNKIPFEARGVCLGLQSF